MMDIDAGLFVVVGHQTVAVRKNSKTLDIRTTRHSYTNYPLPTGMGTGDYLLGKQIIVVHYVDQLLVGRGTFLKVQDRVVRHNATHGFVDHLQGMRGTKMTNGQGDAHGPTFVVHDVRQHVRVMFDACRFGQRDRVHGDHGVLLPLDQMFDVAFDEDVVLLHVWHVFVALLWVGGGGVQCLKTHC
jgi:hypothetical protein